MEIKEGDEVILNDRHQEGFARNWTLLVSIPRIQTVNYVGVARHKGIYLNGFVYAYPEKAFALIHNPEKGE